MKWPEIVHKLYSNAAPSHVSYFINVNRLEDALAYVRVRVRHWLLEDYPSTPLRRQMF